MMMRYKHRYLIWYLLFVWTLGMFMVCVQPVGASSVYYVSTSGSDSAVGSYAAPFKTIHRAINASVSGDTVYIMSGTYTPYNSVNLIGLDNFLLSAYPGANVIVNGTNCPGDINYIDAVFELKECDHTRITGFKIVWSGLGGITVDDTTPECSYIRIDNMTIYECASFAVKAYHGNHIYLENSVIYNNHNNHSTPTEISEEAISFGGTDYGYIYGNTIYGNHCENIDVKSGSTFCYVYDNWINTTSSGVVKKGTTRYCGGIGIYLDGYSTIVNNCSVYNNYVTGNNSQIQVTAELTGSVRDVLVYNNVCVPNGDVSFTQSAGPCIVLGNSGYTSHTYRVDIYMNTLIGDVTGWNYACFNAPQSTTYYHYNRFYNNIVWDRNTSVNYHYGISLANMDPADMSTSTFIMNYNLLYRTQGGSYGQFGVSWKTAARTLGWGANSVNDNPDLTSATDFSLTSVSPCIDVAYGPMHAGMDYAGIVRPQGEGYDIGAYEYAYNSDPVVSMIPDQTITEGSSFVSIALDDYCTDPDNDDSLIIWTCTGQSSITVTFVPQPVIPPHWTAVLTISNVDWYGVETLTFKGTDPHGAYDTDVAVFTVTNVNDPPVISDISGQTIELGSSFSTVDLGDYVYDVDDTGASLTWTVSSYLPLLVVIDGDIATITNPSGVICSVDVLFRCTDDSDEYDEESASFEVLNPSVPPEVPDDNEPYEYGGGDTGADFMLVMTPLIPPLAVACLFGFFVYFIWSKFV